VQYKNPRVKSTSTLNYHKSLKSIIGILFCRRSELCGDLPQNWSYWSSAGELIYKLEMLNMNGL
jgi:hypothetical protein